MAKGDFAAMTALVNGQVQFGTRFREFATQNLNIDSVLRPANVRRYDELDGNFDQDVPPFAIIPADVSPGSPYVSNEQILELSAHYFTPTFSRDARKVTISLANLVPSGQVDGDFLAHYADGSWKRHKIAGGGQLVFCRDDPGWDIDTGYLVASNHGTQGLATGTVEISAKNSCTEDVRLHGTFTGHYSDFLQDTTVTFDVIVIWNRPNDIHDMLNFQYESGSYTFDTTVGGVCGGTLLGGRPNGAMDRRQHRVDLRRPAGSHSRNPQTGLIDNRLN